MYACNDDREWELADVYFDMMDFWKRVKTLPKENESRMLLLDHVGSQYQDEDNPINMEVDFLYEMHDFWKCVAEIPQENRSKILFIYMDFRWYG